MDAGRPVAEPATPTSDSHRPPPGSSGAPAPADAAASSSQLSSSPSPASVDESDRLKGRRGRRTNIDNSRLQTFNFQVADQSRSAFNLSAVKQEDLPRYISSVLRFVPAEVAARYLNTPLVSGRVTAYAEQGVHDIAVLGEQGYQHPFNVRELPCAWRCTGCCSGSCAGGCTRCCTSGCTHCCAGGCIHCLASGCTRCCAGCCARCASAAVLRCAVMLRWCSLRWCPLRLATAASPGRRSNRPTAASALGARRRPPSGASCFIPCRRLLSHCCCTTAGGGALLRHLWFHKADKQAAQGAQQGGCRDPQYNHQPLLRGANQLHNEVRSLPRVA